MRADLIHQVEQALQLHQVVVIDGSKGLDQKRIATAVVPGPGHWDCRTVDGNWQRGGYLAGFQEVIDCALEWCGTNYPEAISKAQQSLKRLFPLCESPYFSLPKDLTNTSCRDERTRFYHHEYQNKLLVGISEFLIEYIQLTGTPILLKIDNASSMSPTALSLVQVVARQPASQRWIKFILIDYERALFLPNAMTLRCPPYSFEEFVCTLGFVDELPGEEARQIFMTSKGNPMIARAIITCEEAGVTSVGYLDSMAIVSLYLSTLDYAARRRLLSDYIQCDCESDDFIAVRNYEMFDSDVADQEHYERHVYQLAEYKSGLGPLKTLHALAIKDKFKRLDALAEPGEILKSIGLYDTWFTYFSEHFADPDLRLCGSGDDLTNAAFISAAFVLYSLGCGSVSSPFLDEFHSAFPNSKYVPTALYAQSMTYGRYQVPVNLPLAEKYALANLTTIEEKFRGWDKYDYIAVFAENAYAYIKARQGKYAEALRLCEDGSQRMVNVYGGRYRLHRSILIYNTSQVYEIIKDYPRAEQQLRLAIACDPYYGEYHNDLGNLLAKLPERAEDALAAYARAIDLCPPYYEAYLNRGTLQARIGRLEEAKGDCKRALEIKPTEWRALLQLGNICVVQDAWQDARRFFEMALTLEPRECNLRCNLGLALSECGETVKSIEQFKVALELNPRHAMSHNNLAIELFNNGQQSEALMHAVTAAEIGGDPDYEKNRDIIFSSV